MSKYIMGVDFAESGDYSAYTVMRRPRWYERLLRKLKLSKSKWEWKVVDHWTEQCPPHEYPKKRPTKPQSGSKGHGLAYDKQDVRTEDNNGKGKS